MIYAASKEIDLVIHHPFQYCLQSLKGLFEESGIVARDISSFIQSS